MTLRIYTSCFQEKKNFLWHGSVKSYDDHIGKSGEILYPIGWFKSAKNFICQKVFWPDSDYMGKINIIFFSKRTKLWLWPKFYLLMLEWSHLESYLIIRYQSVHTCREKVEIGAKVDPFRCGAWDVYSLIWVDWQELLVVQLSNWKSHQPLWNQ